MFLSDPGTIVGLGTKKHGQREALNGGGYEGELGCGGHLHTEEGGRESHSQQMEVRS